MKKINEHLNKIRKEFAVKQGATLIFGSGLVRVVGDINPWIMLEGHFNDNEAKP